MKEDLFRHILSELKNGSTGFLFHLHLSLDISEALLFSIYIVSSMVERLEPSGRKNGRKFMKFFDIFGGNVEMCFSYMM